MAQLEPIKLKANELVNIYAESGIDVGTKIEVHNNGINIARLYDSLDAPVASSGYDNITPNEYLTSVDEPDGAWAISDRGTILQVREV